MEIWWVGDEFITVLWIRIRDPMLFDPWIRYPGWVKNQDPDPGSYFESFKNIFGLKYFDADPGSGMEKIRIRDPG
jgi:hypothetical protein